MRKNELSSSFTQHRAKVNQNVYPGFPRLQGLEAGVEGAGGNVPHSVSVLESSSLEGSGKGRSCWAAEGTYTHRRIWHTARKRYSTFLSAVAGATTVEVDIEVPVFRAIGPTALILKPQKPRTT